jgi:hypothetical protein
MRLRTDPDAGTCQCPYRDRGGCVEALLPPRRGDMLLPGRRPVTVLLKRAVHDPATGVIRYTMLMVRGCRRPGGPVEIWAISCRRSPL